MATGAADGSWVKLVKSFGQGEGTRRTGVVTRNRKGLFKKAKQFLASLLAYEVQRLNQCGDALLQALRKPVK